MRMSWINPIRVIVLLSVLIVGCNNDIYQNPTSPSALPTVWRTGTVDVAGGTFDFPEIGINLIIPRLAIPEGEIFSFQVRGFPSDIPLLPIGPVLVRQGTFELRQVGGDVMNFELPVEVRFRILEPMQHGLTLRSYMLNDSLYWVAGPGNAPVVMDGQHALMGIQIPGIYGAFEAIPLHIEITTSDQQGPVPLSVGFQAIVTGGTPPYAVAWDFGDNSDGKGGLVVAHAYEDPGDYTATATVVDAEFEQITDWVHITAYWIPGPPALP